jgi:hypothetical protein
LAFSEKKSKLSLVHAKISKARMQTLTEKYRNEKLMIARHTLRVLDANHSKERELLCAAA